MVTLKWLKEFWSIPEGQRFLSGCIIVISALCAVIGIMWSASSNQADVITKLNDRIAAMAEHHGNEKERLIRQCDSEKTTIRLEVIADMKADLDEYKAEVREGYSYIRGLRTKQASTNKTTKKTIQQLSK